MQRRTLLSSLTAVGTVAIAGCSNSSAPASDPESTETEEKPQEPFVAYTDVYNPLPALPVLPQVRNPTDEIVERKLWIQLVSEEGEPLARRSKIVELVPTSNGLAAAIPFSFTEVVFSGKDIDIDSTKTSLTATDAESPGEMEQTGVEPFADSTAKVPAEHENKLEVATVVGEAVADGEKIGILRAELSPRKGSDPIDLNKMMYTIATQTKATSINGDSNDTNGLSYSPYQSLENNTTILSGRNDIMVAEFDLTNISGMTPMGERTELRLVLRSPSGGSSYERLQAPSKIDKDKSYIL
jgi:hypothetical protein